MYVFLTKNNCNRGVSNSTNSHCPNIILKKLGVQCFCLFGVTDIHMWQKGLGRFWWTVGDVIEGVMSAIGTHALDFKSFQLQTFWWPERCWLFKITQRVEEGSIKGPSTRQNRYKTGLVNSYIVSHILGSFLCSSSLSDSILPNNVFIYSRNPVSLSISVNL